MTVQYLGNILVFVFKLLERQVYFLYRFHCVFILSSPEQIPVWSMTIPKYRSRTRLSAWPPIPTWQWLTSPARPIRRSSVGVKSISSKIFQKHFPRETQNIIKVIINNKLQVVAFRLMFFQLALNHFVLQRRKYF